MEVFNFHREKKIYFNLNNLYTRELKKFGTYWKQTDFPHTNHVHRKNISHNCLQNCDQERLQVIPFL